MRVTLFALLSILPAIPAIRRRGLAPGEGPPVQALLAADREYRDQVTGLVSDERVGPVLPDMIRRSAPGYATIIAIILGACRTFSASH